MTEIQFYHLTTTPLERALPKLLEKAVGGGHKVLVLAESEARVEQLNQSLWTYNPGSFLPHGSAKDPSPELQPIYLTHTPENPNQAGILVVTDGSPVEPSADCKKLLDMFDGTNEDSVAKARSRWKSYKNAGHALSYFKQSERGAWERMELKTA